MVSNGRKKLLTQANNDNTENKANGLLNDMALNDNTIYGIIITPILPNPFAIPIPVVLILVGYTSAVYWNLLIYLINRSTRI